MAVTQQLLNEDKVFAILTAGSPVVQALVPLAPSLKAPVLLSADADLVRTIPNMYAVNPRYTLLPLFEAQYLIKNLGIKDIAYVYPDDASGRPALKTLPDYVSANGARLVASLPFALDTTDWAPFATQLKESGAQGVVFFNLLMPGLQKAADAIAKGDIGSTLTAQKFNAELKAAGKESIIGLFAESGWTTGAIVEEGVRRATANGAALTWDSFMAALNTFNHQQVGVYPSISYTPQDHTGATQSSIYQVQNGKFVQVLPMTDVPQAPGSS